MDSRKTWCQSSTEHRPLLFTISAKNLRLKWKTMKKITFFPPDIWWSIISISPPLRHLCSKSIFLFFFEGICLWTCDPSGFVWEPAQLKELLSGGNDGGGTTFNQQWQFWQRISSQTSSDSQERPKEAFAKIRRKFFFVFFLLTERATWCWRRKGPDPVSSPVRCDSVFCVCETRVWICS